MGINVFQLWLCYQNYREEQNNIRRTKELKERLQKNKKFIAFSEKLKKKARKK
ncbi:MAG: hypothetical protein NE327_04745 [Lentisphaeraceae bacterium]|nr:hypothetical protein [Lentisphaeraceae bacterium]